MVNGALAPEARITDKAAEARVIFGGIQQGVAGVRDDDVPHEHPSCRRSDVGHRNLGSPIDATVDRTKADQSDRAGRFCRNAD